MIGFDALIQPESRREDVPRRQRAEKRAPSDGPQWNGYPRLPLAEYYMANARRCHGFSGAERTFRGPRRAADPGFAVTSSMKSRD